MDKNEEAFINRLCGALPSMARLNREHLQEHGQLLPYAFLGEVTRYAIKLFEGNTESAKQELTALCGFLEREYARGTPSVRDLIALGVLENMAGPPEPYWGIRDFLGPSLREEIEHMWPSTR